MNLDHLIRRDLVSLEVYPETPTIDEMEQILGRRVIKLDSNENPYGPSPRVFTALAALCAERYPDAECKVLRNGFGRYLGVDPAKIVCSNGGDEMLDLLLRLFLEPGDEMIDLTPSFVMYELNTLYNQGKVVRVPRLDGFQVDVDGIERALTGRTKVIFLCSPNNPTGNSTPDEDIERVIALGRIVVLDEAYAEFAGKSLVHLTERYPNLIVFRTMSKWAALAGMRLGYAVMDPSIATHFRKSKPPYNVGIAAQVAGIASLEDKEYLLANVAKIVAERERLRERLQRLPFGTVYPSETSFLYWRTGGVSPAALKLAMKERGVLIRAFTEPADALRFSVGTPEESDILLAALQEAYAEVVG
jgi:histidinol-phosphate aminotransferase